MTITVNLLTSQDVLDGFHKIVDSSRKRIVSIDREKLDHLLIDYGVLVNALQGSSTFKVTIPDPPKIARTRAKLKT